MANYLLKESVKFHGDFFQNTMIKLNYIATKRIPLRSGFWSYTIPNSNRIISYSISLLIAPLVIVFLSTFESKAQNSPVRHLGVAQLIIEGADTIYQFQIEEIQVFGRRRSYFNAKQYETLYRKVKKVYPFAIQASKELAVYNQKFTNIKDSRAKKEYLKKVEKEMFQNYGDKMKHLTVSEGRYLMLLIDRETGNSSYEIIKDLKGSVPAAFWQGLARLFGNNLKERYEPVKAHYLIEQIVLSIQREGITSTEGIKTK